MRTRNMRYPFMPKRDKMSDCFVDTNGDKFPEWQGNLFSGALAGATLWRIVLDGSGNAVSRQEIAAVKSLGVRIRDARQGPDGNIYLLSNDGNGANANRIVRLSP